MLFFFLVCCFNQWQTLRMKIYIHLKVLCMIMSWHCAGLKQQLLDPAVQHFETTLSTLRQGVDLCKNFRIPLTLRIREHKGRIDLMSKKIVLGICRCHRRINLAWFPKLLIRNAACFHMPVRVPSKAYHHSNYSSEVDEYHQHSISEL